jgi:hypothetical protein
MTTHPLDPDLPHGEPLNDQGLTREEDIKINDELGVTHLFFDTTPYCDSEAVEPTAKQPHATRAGKNIPVEQRPSAAQKFRGVDIGNPGEEPSAETLRARGESPRKTPTPFTGSVGHQGNGRGR